MKEKILISLATFIIKFLGWTCRFKLVFPDKETEAQFRRSFYENKEQFLLGFFHQDELCLLPFFQKSKMAVLISLSKDGEIMKGLSENLGFETVRGSSSKGAARGLLAAIKKVKEGFHFAIAVDGPRGPIYKVKEGLPAISRKTQVPILPARAYPSKAKIFERSWNKAKLPIPFSTIEIRFGELEVYDSQALENKLTSL
ncbi:MAG: lysophospholipid acyltransferase family protein [Bacteriovoracaceae bacterium]|nr:lysophospholipid acyltransferase family protein [Bacteriovoracaceae bacterium]